MAWHNGYLTIFIGIDATEKGSIDFDFTLLVFLLLGYNNISGASCNIHGFCQGHILSFNTTADLTECLTSCLVNTNCNWYTYYEESSFCVLTSGWYHFVIITQSKSDWIMLIWTPWVLVFIWYILLNIQLISSKLDKLYI